MSCIVRCWLCLSMPHNVCASASKLWHLYPRFALHNRQNARLSHVLLPQLQLHALVL